MAFLQTQRWGSWGSPKPAAGSIADNEALAELGVCIASIFNEGGGLKARDLSPYHNHGVIAGTPTWNGGLGLTFNGTGGNSVTYPVLGVPGTAAAYSFRVRCVFAASDLSSQHVIASANNGSGGWVFACGSAANQIDVENFGGGDHISATVAANIPYDISYTFDGSTTHSFYINGVQTTNAGSPASATPTSLWVSTYDGSNEPFFGRIECWMMANICWTPAQALRLFNEPYYWVPSTKRRRARASSAAPAFVWFPMSTPPPIFETFEESIGRGF